MTVTATAKPKVQRRSGGSSLARVTAKHPLRVIAPPAASKRGTVAKPPSVPVTPPAPNDRVSCSFHGDSETVRVPMWVNDLESFRRWAVSDEAPEKVPVFFLDGEVWIDMSKQQIFSHLRVKQELLRVLGNVVRESRLGDMIPDGLLLTNVVANLSGNPDGTFISRESFREKRVRLVEGKKTGYVELEGTPDMVLEVVSDSSVQKDTAILRDLYWKAGIPEFWIVDGRHDAVQFTVLKRTTRGYSAVRNAAGWLKSPVFGKSFRLTRRLDELGHPDFVLDVK